MRILVAARLSQLADGQTGLDTQDSESARWAEANGHTVVHVAMDHKSGTTAPWERKNLRPWVTDPGKLAQYDAVLAYRLDRLSRGDNQSTNEIEAWAHRHGKQLLTVDGLVFPCEGADGIRWDVTKRIAHEEWLKTSERYRRMQAHLREQNKLTGRPCWGYEVADAEGGHKTLVPSPEGRKWVPEVFARVIKGQSLATIARWLESVTGRPWWPRTVGHMVRTTTYAGYRQDAEGRTILRVEPLVDMATWKRANAALDNRPKKGPALEHRAMLTSVIFCPRCQDSPMYRIHAGSSFYYRCTGRGPNRKGCGNMVPLEQADAMVCDIAATTFSWQKVTLTVFTPGHSHEAELEALRFELKELPRRDLAWDAEDAERARLRAEYDRLAALPSAPDRAEEVETDQTYADVWNALEPSERNAWLEGARVPRRGHQGAADALPAWPSGPPCRHRHRRGREVREGSSMNVGECC